MFLRALQAVGWFFVIAASIAICVIAGRAPPTGNPVVEYKDFVSILLTALGVMIAVGAVVAAIAAIYGFELLRREAAATAQRVAAETAAQTAQTKIDEIVPSLVEKAMKVEQEVTGKEADKIAEEFGKES